MQNSNQRPYITVDEAAEELGVTRRFLEGRIADGELRVFRPSSRLVRLKRLDWEAWKESYSFGGGAKTEAAA